MIKDNGDIPEQCPYDSTHIVCSRGLGMHLIRCRLNHRGHKKVTCKFDKTHLVPKPEMPHHLSICPSRYLLDRELQLKAGNEAGGVLSGDVTGPKILTNYVNDNDEDWDTEPGARAPIALFNRKEMEYDEESKPDRPVGAAPEERIYRKFPITSSNAEKLSEKPSYAGQLNENNQVYLVSLMQSLNTGAQSMTSGWGRGRGVSHNQAPATRHPACLTELPNKPASTNVHSNSRNSVHDSRITAERNSFDHQVPHNNTPNLHKFQNLSNDTLTQDEFPDFDSPVAVQNPHRKKSSHNSLFRHSSGTPSATDTYNAVVNSQRQLNFPAFSALQISESSPTAQILPAGRGIFRGNEALKPLTRATMAQGAGSSVQQNVKNTKTSAKQQKQSLAEEVDGHDSSTHESEDVDLSTLSEEKLLKKRRGLVKKLKQIKDLEKRLSGGEKLTNEEKFKLEKKSQIESSVEEISKLM